MTSIPSPRPHVAVGRRLAAVLIGVVAEVALLAALAHAAWSESDSENVRTLSPDEGLTTIAILGLPAFLLILGACFLIAFPKRWGTAGASVLLALAGTAGFVGYALTSFSRVEMSDC